MEQSLFIVLIVGAVALIIIASLYAKKQAEERRAAMFEIAQRHGLEFYPYGLARVTSDAGFFDRLFGLVEAPADRFLEAFRGFDPFGKGHSPEVSNLIAGRREGVDWFIFDYNYKVTTSNGKTTTTTTYRNGIAAVRIPMTLPGMRLSRESFMDRVMEKLGRREVEFESAEFNKLYFVQCRDQKAAYDLIHPQMMEYLLSIPVRDWQFAGPFLLIWQNSYYSPMEIHRVMQDIEGFLERVPNYVKQDRGFAMPWANPFDNMS